TRRHGKIHIRHPHRNQISGTEVLCAAIKLHRVSTFALNGLIKIKYHRNPPLPIEVADRSLAALAILPIVNRLTVGLHNLSQIARQPDHCVRHGSYASATLPVQLPHPTVRPYALPSNAQSPDNHLAKMGKNL